MHMADALLSPGVAGVMYAASAVAAGHSVHKLEQNRDTTDKIIPTMGVMGAFVFAAQMINFTIPGTGSSGHLCGGMLLTAIVGPFAAFLTMIGVLLIQCLLFADGGLMALGANVWNMAFYGCFVGGLLWKAMMQRGISKRKIVVASLLGCVLTLQMGALSVSVETLASGITELPFTAFLLAMQPIHSGGAGVFAAGPARTSVADPDYRRGQAAADAAPHAGHCGRGGGDDGGGVVAVRVGLPRWAGMVAAAHNRQH